MKLRNLKTCIPLLVCYILVIVSASNTSNKNSNSNNNSKSKRGVFHGLQSSGYSYGALPQQLQKQQIVYGLPKSSPYARFPGIVRTPGGGSFILAPGGASVNSYSSVLPKYYQGGFGYPTKAFLPTKSPIVPYSPIDPYSPFGPYSSIASYSPIAPYSPVAPYSPIAPYSPPITQYTPIAPQPASPIPPFDPYASGVGKFVPSSFSPLPTVLPLPPAHSNAAESSFFGTYPQKSYLPFSFSQLPDFVKNKLPSVFTKFFNPNFLQRTPYDPAVTVTQHQNPLFSVPTIPTPTTNTNIGQGFDPWKPVLVPQPTPLIPTPATNTILKPSIKLLPPYGTSGSSNGQPSTIYLPAPSSSSSPVEENNYNDIDEQQLQQAYHQAREEAHASQVAQFTAQQGSPFNGQPYDPPSNNGRYLGPSSYEVDINQGYQK